MTQPETLAQRVLRVQREMVVADPHQIAKQVIVDLDGDYLDALAELLPEYVRHVLIRERNAAMNTDPAPTPTADVTPLPSRTPRYGSVSKKVRAAQWWQRLLDSRLPDGEGGWKRFGDCVRADLIRSAEENEGQAAAQLVQAGRKRQVASLLPDETTTVRQLDAGVVGPIFGIEAAA